MLLLACVLGEGSGRDGKMEEKGDLPFGGQRWVTEAHNLQSLNLTTTTTVTVTTIFGV